MGARGFGEWTERALATAGAALLVCVLNSCAHEDKVTGITADQDLATYKAEKATVKKLHDGTRIAVGSRTGHDVTVQWSPEGSGRWTPGVVVDRVEDRWTHDIRVTTAGNTVAIAPDWWRERVLDDDYSPEHTSLVVCRPGVCEKPRHAHLLSSAQFDERGHRLIFPTGERRMLLWTDQDGVRDNKVSGISGDANIRMLADGSVIGVSGRWDGVGCHYDLLSAGDDFAFHRAATSPRFPDTRPCPLSSTTAEGTNSVSVFVDSLGGDFHYVLREGEWQVQMPHGPPMSVRETNGLSTITPQRGDAGGVQVLVGSSDTRTVRAQSRLPGTDAWSPEQVIAAAPKGTRCRMVATSQTEKALLAVVGCYATSVSWPPPSDVDQTPTVSLVLGTSNGTTWTALPLPHGSLEVHSAGRYLFVSGPRETLLYAAGYDDFVHVRLPLSVPYDGFTLTPDGRTAIRVLGKGSPTGPCRPRQQSARITATTWSRATPVDLGDTELGDVPARCLASVDPEFDGPRGVYTVRYSRLDHEAEQRVQWRDGALSRVSAQ